MLLSIIQMNKNKLKNTCCILSSVTPHSKHADGTAIPQCLSLSIVANLSRSRSQVMKEYLGTFSVTESVGVYGEGGYGDKPLMYYNRGEEGYHLFDWD
ncbi:hypothetical protein F2Q68_00046569 [Brassica cretica]|uniref:Uncharacterized protein n=1 Tax=Brassica cretica TaxID=69181 RepID=A0A8S9LI92_BRACR|nr:hypothetical protein F2Q68_00046569 [Brassica cretica]